MVGFPVPPSIDTRYSICAAMAIACLLVGCSGESNSSSPTAEFPSSASVKSNSSQPADATSQSNAGTAASKSDEKFDFKPLTLNGVSGSTADASTAGSKPDSEKQIQSVIANLQPLQILLGQWRGTTRRDYEDFKAVDNHEWVWDLRSNPNQPALTIKSDKSPYIKTARVTWDTQQNRFTMTVADPTGVTKEFAGDFSEPVHEIVGSDDKLHKVFRLEFNQTESGDDSELWQFAFAQQENNRYLLEIAKRRGKAAFSRFDTVSTQREGTSFAVSDTGYAERTCIISEGLGTTEVTYKGRSYWVCCSGCKAAFEEDPETWIARAAKKVVPK
ncbi:MAG: hypothetical protein O2856_14845 [Planctomycetota bacterium]|nr:hypothetical protein [Planctomycetota bacterium]